MTKVAIIDYSMGNVASVSQAFLSLGYQCVIGNSYEVLKESDALILPGVGAFSEGMSQLHKSGLVNLLSRFVIDEKKPFLGICLGMQLIFNSSEEFGYTQGLSWVNGTVKKLDIPAHAFLPHVGWNDLHAKKDTKLYKGIKENIDVYFDHSFCVDCDSELVTASTDYYGEVPASISVDNIHATQYHPEKSQRVGLKVLRNFMNYVEANE